jgi:hypothetical protein
MVGSRTAACLLLLSFLAWPSTASTLESATDGFVAYQFDGATHHDAPDACADADPAWSVSLGNRTDGILAPPDDLADVYVIDVPPSHVGMRVDLRVMEGPGSLDVDLGAYAPMCDGDVFAPQNQPVPFPAPPAPADGEQQVALPGATKAWHCGDEWIFVATQMDGATPPQDLHAAWTDGSEGKVPLVFSNPEGAVYIVDGPAFTLKGAWINLPASWDGKLLLFRDPCDAADGGAVYGDPAALFDDRISFTPVRAGPHAVRITLADPQAPAPATSVPMTCHVCFDEVEQVAAKASYFLSALATTPAQ